MVDVDDEVFGIGEVLHLAERRIEDPAYYIGQLPLDFIIPFLVDGIDDPEIPHLRLDVGLRGSQTFQ